MKKLVLGSRVALGLLFLIFGINYFIPFMPSPEVPPEGGALLGAFFNAGYMFPLIKGTEVVGGLLVLLGFVPIGLILLSAVAVNIFAFHLFLAPAGMALPIVIVGLMLFLAWAYKEKFYALFEREELAYVEYSKKPSNKIYSQI